MKATYSPATPAVVKEVEPAKEASVTLTLTLEETAKLRALVGNTRGWQLTEVFDALADTVDKHRIPRQYVVGAYKLSAIKFSTKESDQ